jgi:hypothetical protein
MDRIKKLCEQVGAEEGIIWNGENLDEVRDFLAPRSKKDRVKYATVVDGVVYKAFPYERERIRENTFFGRKESGFISIVPLRMPD